MKQLVCAQLHGQQVKVPIILWFRSLNTHACTVGWWTWCTAADCWSEVLLLLIHQEIIYHLLCDWHLTSWWSVCSALWSDESDPEGGTQKLHHYDNTVTSSLLSSSFAVSQFRGYSLWRTQSMWSAKAVSFVGWESQNQALINEMV